MKHYTKHNIHHKVKLKVLLLYITARLDSFSSTLQPYSFPGDSPKFGANHHLEMIRADRQLTSNAGLAPVVCPPYVASPNFTPWYIEAHMSSHLAQGCYTVNQLAALIFKPTPCIFRVPGAIHLATASPNTPSKPIICNILSKETLSDTEKANVKRIQKDVVPFNFHDEIDNSQLLST